LLAAYKSGVRITAHRSSEGSKNLLSIQRFVFDSEEWSVDCWCHTNAEIVRLPIASLQKTVAHAEEAFVLPGEVLAEKFLEESEVKVTYQAGNNLEVLENWLHEQHKNQMSSDDRPVKKKYIRPVGKAPKAPLASSSYWTGYEGQFQIDQTASFSKRMVLALEALIEDIRRTGNGASSLQLIGGKPYLMEGHGECYQFEYESDLNLYEGLKVFAVVDKKKLTGEVISLSADSLMVSFENATGLQITECTIEINNTSLLERLKDRMDVVRKDKSERFNTKLASRVIRGSQPKPLDRKIPASLGQKLNESQKAAVTHALSSDISYIWGPPGTGKTYALGELVRILYQQGEKVLVCSNTNQAVDQLLLKLCQGFGKSSAALRDGHVVRIGSVEHQELSGEWGEFINFDHIFERKAKKLRNAKSQLEIELAPLTDLLTKLRTILSVIQEHKKLEKPFEAIKTSLKQNETRKREIEKRRAALPKEANDRISDANEEIAKLEFTRKNLIDEKEARAKAAIKLWHRSQSQISRELKNANIELNKFSSSIKNIKDEQKASELKLVKSGAQLQEQITKEKAKKERIEKDLKDCKSKIGRNTEGEINKKISTTEAKVKPLAKKLSELENELIALRNSIAKNAKVLGTTITKTYLEPDAFKEIDVVIVDEASMVILPAIAVVTVLAKKTVVISGDFQQLQPIVSTNQTSIKNEIGRSIFEHSGVQRKCEDGTRTPLVTMLQTQYRMPKAICDLVAGPFYRGRLTTADTPVASKKDLGGDEESITIIDTSSLKPLEQLDQGGSRYNLMHAAVVLNIVKQLNEEGEIPERNSLGICTPFAAQAKILNALVQDEGLGDQVRAGTVHRWQGDEATTMILDIPIGESRRKVGRFLEAEKTSEDGAKLFNVALTRTRARLVVIANLKNLDQRLPNHAVVRDLLSRAEDAGRVLAGKKFLTVEEMRLVGKQSHTAAKRSEVGGSQESGEFTGKASRKLLPSSESLTKDSTRENAEEGVVSKPAPKRIKRSVDRVRMFNEESFGPEVMKDIQTATYSIAIYSGFVTKNRVQTYIQEFQKRIKNGVTIRCITRPPSLNGSNEGMRKSGKQGLQQLKKAGCLIDLRSQIHQKIVIIDEQVVWFGSLNPLSHTTKTDETMQRTEGHQYAKQLASFVALDPVRDVSKADGISVAKENPNCPSCRSEWVIWVKQDQRRRAKSWECGKCGHKWQGVTAVASKVKSQR
jgi:superfamily I DNA and/or RNA helicase/ribosomal protein L37AE/L43A